MDSAGKRNKTEGTARGKRKLEDEKEAESSKKPNLDDSESDLSTLDPAELDKLAKSIEDSPEPQVTQPAPSSEGAPAPAPADSTPAPAPADSTPAPAPADSSPAAGPSQPTPMGPPAPLSPPSLTGSVDTPTERYLPDGVGIPVEDNDA